MVDRSVIVVVRRSVGHRRRSSLFFETDEHLERSKRVLARDDGVTMTTVDGINIAYFQGPNSLKVLSNRQRSIDLRPLPPTFIVASELGTVGRVRSCACNIYIYIYILD